MTDDVKRNFLGIPIIGTPMAGSTRVEQYPQEDFEEIVARVLANKFFHDFGWTQYTPYFNDGEPCEFGANGFWIRTVKDAPIPTGSFTFQKKEDEDDEDPEDGLDEKFAPDAFRGHPSLGKLDYPNDYWVNNVRQEGVYVGDRMNDFYLAKELQKAVEEGHFENVLLDLFGDHCQVKVSRTGITIDEYSHE